MTKLSRITQQAVMMGVVIGFSAGIVEAQPGPRGGPGGGGGGGPGMMMGPGMMGGNNFNFMCNPRSAGMAEWRTQRIESELKPTEAQKKLLDDLKAASTKSAELLNATCTGDVPSKSVERLALVEKRTEAALQAIRLVRPAFEKFYGSLDEPQKAKLDAIGPRRWGWRNWRWRDR